MDWQPEYLRLTLFFSSDAPTSAAEHVGRLWPIVSSSEADDLQTRPKEGLAALNLSISESANMTLQMQGRRMDFGFFPKPVGFDLPNIGPLEALSNEFYSKSKIILEDAVKVNRIAISGAFTAAVSSPEAGYEILANLIDGYRLKFGDVTDFMLRANRPTQSASMPELRLNRIGTWAVLTRKVHDANGAAVVPDLSAVRVELDINTQAERSEALPDLVIMHDELDKHFKEKLKNGDRS